MGVTFAIFRGTLRGSDPGANEQRGRQVLALRHRDGGVGELTGRGQITTRQGDFDGIECALRDSHLGLGHAQAIPGRLGGIVCRRNVARRQACLGDWA